MKHILAYLLFGFILLLGSTSAAEDSVITFLSDVRGDYDIIVVNMDGEIIERIETDKMRKAALTLSPNRFEFAYSSNALGGPDIYKMDIRDKKPIQLTKNQKRNFRPEWSPNGKWIIFVSDRGGQNQLFRMDADGTNLLRLTDRGNCGVPAWSPDSQWIAIDIDHENPHAIYLLNPEGKELRQVTEDLPLFPGCCWSPDGERLAFLSGVFGLGAIELYTIDINGLDKKQLTNLGVGNRVSNPAWSPDGKWITFGLIKVEQWPMENNAGRIVFGGSTLHVIDSEGVGKSKELKKVAELTDNHKPMWIRRGFYSVSPDGEKKRVTWGEIKQP